jgi:hypothetical protein
MGIATALQKKTSHKRRGPRVRWLINSASRRAGLSSPI